MIDTILLAVIAAATLVIAFRPREATRDSGQWLKEVLEKQKVRRK